MKTMIVVASRRMSAHNGEEYDAVVEVPNNPDSENIGRFGEIVRNNILRLHDEQVKAGEKTPKVVVTLDAASPFSAMLRNLRIILKKQFGVDVELPHCPVEIDVPPNDSEARELLKRIGCRS